MTDSRLHQTPTPHAAAWWMAGVATAILLSVGVFWIWSFTPDDSFITFRYAQQLAEGHGAVFNATGPRAEGYTSPLWMVLCSAGLAAGLPVLVYAKSLSIMLAFLALVATAALVRRLGGNRREMIFAVVVLSAVPHFWAHAVSAMETMLACVLFTLLLAELLGRSAPPWRFGLLCLALGLTRPELNLAAGIGCMVYLAKSPQRARALWQIALTYALPGALYFALRWWYYGVPLPLPFYMKVAGDTAFPAGWKDVARFSIWSGVHLGAGLVPLLWWRRSAICWWAFLPLGALWFFFLIPHHEMGYGYRFLFPLVPGLVALSAMGVGALSDKLTERNWCKFRPALLVTTLLVVGFLLEAPRHGGFYRRYASGLAAAHVPLGEALARCREAAGTEAVLAIGDAGAVPFLSGWHTVDTFGLNDAERARGGDGARRQLPDPTPTVLVLISSGADHFVAKLAHEESLYAEATARGMEHVRSWRFGAEYYLWVLVAEGSGLEQCLGR